MNQGPSEMIAVGELRIGMFVELGIGWMSHPFPTGSFRLASERQIEAIRALGLSHVKYFPDRSDAPPMAGSSGTAVSEAQSGVRAIPSADDGTAADAAAPALAGRRERRLRSTPADEQRRRQLRCERGFQEAALLYKLVLDQVQAQPRLIKDRCEAMVRGLLDDLLLPGDSSIRLLSTAGGERACLHAVNVSVLSLLLGKAMGLPREQLLELGHAAFLHDIGKILLPERVRSPDEALSAPEYRLYQEHVLRSVELGQLLGLSGDALTAIGQHHELLDGSGFPRRSRDAEVGLPGRILALVNRYDNLCNPVHPAAAMTPHEALSSIFTQMKGRFDGSVVSAFIRMLGVHPPGSIVQLTNDRYAMVVMANTSRPLKPRVLIHDPQVPRHDALIQDLEAMPDIGIRRSIKPGNLPQESADYLAPRQRICCFFERTEPETQAA